MSRRSTSDARVLREARWRRLISIGAAIGIALSLALPSDAQSQRESRGTGKRGGAENSESRDAVSEPGNSDFVARGELGAEVIIAIRRPLNGGTEAARARGMLATGLVAKFDTGVYCRTVDDGWAMDYSEKRGRDALHGGIDIPAPRGTPVLAMAAGEVVGKFENDDGAQGLQIWLRHSPDDTGLPKWVYSQYAHLLELPPLAVGQRVRMGEEIGKTSNTGISGEEARSASGPPIRNGKSGGLRERRDAVHFATIYTDSPRYYRDESILIPQDSRWVDPHALYRRSGQFDSIKLAALPAESKSVEMPYVMTDGRLSPADTKLIWPYACGSAPLSSTRRNDTR